MGCEALGPRVHQLLERPLPAAVRSAAERALLNVAAAAIGGSRQAVVEDVVRMSAEHGGARVAAIVGHAQRGDAYFSALVAGTAARVLDVDDVHLETRFSPSAAPLGTLIALASTNAIAGSRALSAFALGCEVSIRLAVAASPHHYSVGWDASGTCGVIGATVCGALLAGADALQVTNAIGIAASQTLGHREALGTPSGALHAGKAASNGLIAALLARQGFTGALRLDHPDGFFTAFPVADSARLDAIVADLGERWRILEIVPKPYPGEPSGDPPAQPLSDEARFAKVRGLVEPVMPGSSDALIAAVQGLHEASTATQFVEALAPQGAGVAA